MAPNDIIPQSQKNLFYYWLWFVVFVCLLPLLLNQTGIDFGSRSIEQNDIGANNLFYAVRGAMHHALLEWSAVSLAIMVALSSYLHYIMHRDVTIPIIGSALLCAGLVDAFHTLAAMRLIEANAPNIDFIPFTWSLSRIFNASIMIIGASISLWIYRQSAGRNEQEDINKALTVNRLPILLTTAVIFIGIAYTVVHLAAVSDSLPQTMYPQELITRPFDVFPLALFLFGGSLFWLWFQQSHSAIKLALLLSVIPEISTQLYMAFGSMALFDNHFNIAHALKLFAYGIILVGILLDLALAGKAMSVNSIKPAHESIYTDTGALNSQKRMDVGKATHPLSVQIPVAVFSLTLIVALAVGYSFYFQNERLVIQQEIDELDAISELADPMLAQLYRQTTGDIRLLGSNPYLQQLSSENGQVGINHYIQHKLEQLFVKMLDSNPNYTQIRYIDIADNGRELIKAVLKDNQATITPPSLHPFLRDSDFYVATSQLTKGEVYYSPVALNREQHQIAVPHQSVVRASTPIIDNNGKQFGIIIIDINFAAFITQLKQQHLTGLTLYLANQEGDYLDHPDPDLNFGFDLGQRRLIQQQFPGLDKYIKQGIPAHGFSKLADHQGDRRVSYFRIIDLQQYGNPHPLIILLQPSASDSRSVLQSFRLRSLLIGISLAFAALALAVLASRRIAKPLIQMIHAVKVYERSAYLEPLPIKAINEIGVLARSFHNLLIRINDALLAEQQSASKACESSEKLQAILNNAADAMINIDPQGNILSFNTAAETMFGYRETEILGNNINILIPIHFAQEHNDGLHQHPDNSYSQLIGVDRELSAKRNDGSVFAIHLSISEVNTAQGTLFTGIIRDISRQKQIEEQRKHDVSLLEATLESTDNGILVTNHQGKALRSNTRFSEMWCISDHLIDSADEQEMLEHIVEQLLNPQQFLQGVEDLYADPSTESFDTLHFKDGRVFERTSRPMIVSGQAAGRMWSFHDITLSKQTEEALIEAKEAAENVARYKSQFLASMSHEIRTPMNGVLGMLELLRQSKLDKEQRHHTLLAQSSAESLLIIINDILDFSKFESGKLELELIDYNLRSQLGEFAEAIGHRAQEKGLELILDVAGIKQSMVRGDPGRLRQILTNLVGNAIKFTPEGEIFIGIELHSAADDRLQLSCFIADTGIGIEADKLDTLFDSFTQVDASTTREYGGTGLGLAIAKQLCDLMEGHISVTSEPGKGSCFSFDILLHPSQMAELVLPKVAIKGIPILIVDDNTTNRTMLYRQLQQWGADVTEADSGKMALSLLEQRATVKDSEPFMVAFIDMHMPTMNGLSLGQAIREQQRFNTTRMVMMTSLSNRGDARLFAEAGFCAYFPKPTTTDDLFDSLAVVIDGGDAFSQAQPLITHHYLKGLRHSDETRLPDNKQIPEAKAFNHGCRLLLVEDNLINQAVCLALLDNLGIDCDVADNGVIALETLNNAPADSPYSLIFMDCQMPEMDGYEATRQIRKGAAGDAYSEIPIVAMTANAMAGDKEKCLGVGMSDYMSKPIELHELEKTLQHWLE